MSRYSGNPNRFAVYEAASHWKERCLMADGSVFAARELWNTQNLDYLYRHFTEQPDESKDSFMDKLSRQFALAPGAADQLLAEMLWTLYLPVARTVSPDKKREHIRAAWSWSGETLPDSQFLSDECLSGLGSAGTGYNTNFWLELSYAIDVFISFKALGEGARSELLSNAWRFADWLEDLGDTAKRQFRHMLTHMLFPDQFERIFTRGHRNKVLQRLDGKSPAQLNKMRNSDKDRALFDVRQRMAAELGTADIDFYLSPLKERWQPHQFKFDADALARYEQNFLAHFPGDRSFESETYLDSERRYKLEIAQHFADIDLDQPDSAAIFDELAALFTRPLECDGQPQNLLDWRTRDFLKNLSRAQKAEYAAAVRDLVADRGSLTDRADAFAGTLSGLMTAVGEKPIPSNIRGFTSFYLMASDPARHPFVRTTPFKQALRELTGEELSDDADQFQFVERFLDALRKELERRGWQPRDALDLQGFLWMARQPPTSPADVSAERVAEPRPVAIELPDVALNRILYGPPGTGKTHHTIDCALEVLDPNFLSEHATDRDALKSRFNALQEKGRVEFVTFHQSFSYEDFVEGIRARVVDGAVVYEVADGVFKALCARCQSGAPHVLIIDEINRGNIASIFGELITLIEPSKRVGRQEALTVQLPYSRQRFGVPHNLYLVGTMNTADRSLVQVDTALRRRFQFEEMMPNLDLLDGIFVDGVDIRRMVSTINARIELLFDREHTLGHSFFLPLKNDPNIELLASIFGRQVLPLLEEYFFEDWSRIAQVLGDSPDRSHEERFFVDRFTGEQIENLLGDDPAGTGVTALRRNPDALNNPQAYEGIYTPPSAS